MQEEKTSLPPGIRRQDIHETRLQKKTQGTKEHLKIKYLIEIQKSKFFFNKRVGRQFRNTPRKSQKTKKIEKIKEQKTA